MRAKGFVGVATVLALNLAVIGIVQADPIVTFQVPVKLENLHPDIVKARIDCEVGSWGYPGTNSNSKDVPITGGKYVGTVSVPVDYGKYTKEQLAVHLEKGDLTWACRLSLGTTNGNNYALSTDNVQNKTLFIDTMPIFKRKDGAPFVGKVGGPFKP
jgi:hypothetical protein